MQMNRILLPLLAAVLTACSSVQPPVPPAPPAAPVAPPAVAKAAPKFSVNTTPIEVLEADPAAHAVVKQHLTKLFDHPAYAMIKSMTLKELLPYSQGALTEERLQALQADLDLLK